MARLSDASIAKINEICDTIFRFDSAPVILRVYPLILNDANRTAILLDHKDRNAGVFPRPGTIFAPDFLACQNPLLKIPINRFLSAPRFQQPVIGLVIPQPAQGNRS